MQIGDVELVWSLCLDTKSDRTPAY